MATLFVWMNFDPVYFDLDVVVSQKYFIHLFKWEDKMFYLKVFDTCKFMHNIHS